MSVFIEKMPFTSY